LEVRRGRLTIEEERKVVGWMDLAERERCAQRRVGADERRIDAEFASGTPICSG